MASNSLIAFFEGTGTDHKGRLLTEILAESDQWLECKHDYIQTLFPLPEQSAFAWGTELVDMEVFIAFRQRPDLRESLRTAFRRILKFWGFKLVRNVFELSLDGEAKVTVVRAENFMAKARNWTSRFDHNHLRITRVLRCLRILGLSAEAAAFLRALADVCREASIGDNSMDYWRRAGTRPLYIRPDVDEDEEDEATGPAFLMLLEKRSHANLPTIAHGSSSGAPKSTPMQKATISAPPPVTSGEADGKRVDSDTAKPRVGFYSPKAKEVLSRFRTDQNVDQEILATSEALRGVEQELRDIGELRAADDVAELIIQKDAIDSMTTGKISESPVYDSGEEEELLIQTSAQRRRPASTQRMGSYDAAS